MLSILGMGYCLAKNELTNKFLHEEVGLEKGQDWVDSRLGIERRFSVLSREYIKKTKNADPGLAVREARAAGQTPVALGTAAALAALKDAQVKPEKVGWVIANNDTPFETIPSTANFIAKSLGVGSGPHCDLNSACSSFARHMQAVADCDESRLPEFVLCVQTGTYTTRTDYSGTSVDGYIWGDGASAQVLSTRHPGKLKVEPMIFATEPAGADEIVIDSAGHFRQNGSAVREFSIRKTCEMFEAIAAQKNVYAEEAYTVAHQANHVMQDSIIGHLRLPAERHLRNVREQGNIAAAGAPSAIAQNLGRLRKGDQLIYAVLGAGLAWGGGYMEVQ